MNISDVVIILLLIGFMAANIPVYICLYITSVLSLILFTSFPIQLLTQTLLRSLDNFALVVVLFFILCGNTMSTGDIVKRLIRVANALVGWLPGGLGMAGVIGCALFGAISGSTVATVVAIGGVMIPALLQNGYNERYTVGVMATSPNLGVIIPPSISMILYSMISNVSLEGLFLTGFVPGIMIVLLTCIYTYFQFKHVDFYENKNSGKKFNGKELIDALKYGIWALLLPVIIFGGIFSGIFTATEAAIIASVYAFIIELFIHRSISLKEVKKITVESAVTSASLLIIVAGATCFGRVLTLENIPFRISSMVVEFIQSPILFLLVVNIIFLFIGMFMDIISATLILGPVFIPMLHNFNIHPMHFGLIMTVNLAIGYCTPPMGVSLFITSALARKSFIFVSKSVLPFLIIQLIVLAVITYLPDLTLFLPKALGFLK